jgi:hypothetical protein
LNDAKKYFSLVISNVFEEKTRDPEKTLNPGMQAKNLPLLSSSSKSYVKLAQISTTISLNL